MWPATDTVEDVSHRHGMKEKLSAQITIFGSIRRSSTEAVKIASQSKEEMQKLVVDFHEAVEGGEDDCLVVSSSVVTQSESAESVAGSVISAAPASTDGGLGPEVKSDDDGVVMVQRFGASNVVETEPPSKPNHQQDDVKKGDGDESGLSLFEEFETVIEIEPVKKARRYEVTTLGQCANHCKHNNYELKDGSDCSTSPDRSFSDNTDGSLMASGSDDGEENGMKALIKAADEYDSEGDSTFVDSNEGGSGRSSTAGPSNANVWRLPPSHSSSDLSDHDPNESDATSDNGSESESDDETELENQTRICTISRRSEYHGFMANQDISVFERIEHVDKGLPGCLLTLGDPPRSLVISKPLYDGAKKLATKAFMKWAGKGDRDAQFKERNKIPGTPGTVAFRLDEEGSQTAAAALEFCKTVLGGILKTATPGSTYLERVNLCGVKGSDSADQMLRSQPALYLTVFSLAVQHAVSLRETPISDDDLKLVVYELIYHEKTSKNARIICHRVDGEGIKISTQKRKQREEKKVKKKAEEMVDLVAQGLI